ncbi:hypothetical protein ACJ72_08670, partial [Emergomyces africanus]
SLRHRDQSHLHTHSYPHLQLHLHHRHQHHPNEDQQQQQQQQRQQRWQLDGGLLDTDLNLSKPGVVEKDKEKRRYRHRRHVSRDVHFPSAVRDHASMSLRPGNLGIKDKGRGTGGHASGVEELGVVPADSAAARSFEANGLDASESGSGTTTEERLPFGRRRENVTMAEVRRERIRRMKDEESNRTSLNTLSTLSATITRRLDTTYYSLLEKIANLHTAIYSFHTLSTTAATLHSDFAHETDNLARDTTTQIDEFHSSFDAQIQRIESFEARMRAGAEKAAALNRRMEIVRQKIEAWDRREGEWQRRVTTRLRIFWAVVGTAVVVLVVAWGVQQLGPIEPSVAVGDGLGMGLRIRELGVDGTNVSTANSTCGRAEQGTENGGDVWVDPTCSRLPFRQ